MSRRDDRSSSQLQLLQISLKTRSIGWALRTGDEGGLVRAFRRPGPVPRLAQDQAGAGGADSAHKLAVGVACSGLEDSGTQQLHPQG